MQLSMEHLGYSSASVLLWGPKATAPMKTQVRQSTEKYILGLMNRYHRFPSMQEKEEERTSDGAGEERSFTEIMNCHQPYHPFLRAWVCMTSPTSQLGISKAHVWAKLSQRQLRGYVFPHFMPAFISFNSSDPTHSVPKVKFINENKMIITVSDHRFPSTLLKSLFWTQGTFLYLKASLRALWVERHR